MCATWSVHTLRVARFLTHVSCVAYRHRVHAWLKVFAVRMSYLPMSPPFSCFIRLCCSRTVTHFALVCTFLDELLPIRKRGSSALPHERRGVWLPGRSHSLHNSEPNNTDGPKRELRGNPSAIVKSNMHNPILIKHTNVIPTNIDHIPSNTTNSGSGAMLYVSEDNEAVIKIMIKGRSPTMRHVSRTHRVALDWLFDRINFGPKNSNPLH